MERETNIDFSSIKISQHTLDHSIFYSVELPQILASDNGKTSQQLKFTIAYVHQLEPLPKQIKKTSKQFVVYQANKYFYSPYKTEKLGTKYTFASDKFKSYTKLNIINIIIHIITNSILEIRPRYPLYGGWKTDFIIGYDVPSSELISIDSISRVHTLNISFNIPFKDPVTDLLITIIALPEGAHDVKVICPYDILLELESKRFTYLDTIIGGGRPLITFT